MKLARLRSTRSPRLDVLSILVEFRHPGVVITIGNENISSGVPSHICRAIEIVPRSARPCRRFASRTHGHRSAFPLAPHHHAGTFSHRSARAAGGISAL